MPTYRWARLSRPCEGTAAIRAATLSLFGCCNAAALSLYATNARGFAELVAATAENCAVTIGQKAVQAYRLFRRASSALAFSGDGGQWPRRLSRSRVSLFVWEVLCRVCCVLALLLCRVVAFAWGAWPVVCRVALSVVFGLSRAGVACAWPACFGGFGRFASVVVVLCRGASPCVFALASVGRLAFGLVCVVGFRVAVPVGACSCRLAGASVAVVSVFAVPRVVFSLAGLGLSGLTRCGFRCPSRFCGGLLFFG